MVRFKKTSHMLQHTSKKTSEYTYTCTKYKDKKKLDSVAWGNLSSN